MRPDDDFRNLRWRAGLSPAELAGWVRVSERTVRAWDKGAPVPWAVHLLLHLRRGDLGALDAAWAGWWLTRGRLFPPGDDRFGVSADDVRAAPYAVAGPPPPEGK